MANWIETQDRRYVDLEKVASIDVVREFETMDLKLYNSKKTYRWIVRLNMVDGESITYVRGELLRDKTHKHHCSADMELDADEWCTMRQVAAELMVDCTPFGEGVV